MCGVLKPVAVKQKKHSLEVMYACKNDDGSKSVTIAELPAPEKGETKEETISRMMTLALVLDAFMPTQRN